MIWHKRRNCGINHGSILWKDSFGLYVWWGKRCENGFLQSLFWRRRMIKQTIRLWITSKTLSILHLVFLSMYALGNSRRTWSSHYPRISTLPPGILFQDDSSFYLQQRSARRTDGSTEKWRTNLPREAIPLFCRDGDSLQGMNSYCWVDSIFEFGEKWSVHFWSPRKWKRCPFYAQTAIRDLNFGLCRCITALRLSILIFAVCSPLCCSQECSFIPRSIFPAQGFSECWNSPRFFPVFLQKGVPSTE